MTMGGGMLGHAGMAPHDVSRSRSRLHAPASASALRRPAGTVDQSSDERSRPHKSGHIRSATQYNTFLSRHRAYTSPLCRQHAFYTLYPAERCSNQIPDPQDRTISGLNWSPTGLAAFLPAAMKLSLLDGEQMALQCDDYSTNTRRTCTRSHIPRHGHCWTARASISRMSCSHGGANVTR
jgi:hypothetical protein